MAVAASLSSVHTAATTGATLGDRLTNYTNELIAVVMARVSQNSPMTINQQTQLAAINADITSSLADFATDITG